MEKEKGNIFIAIVLAGLPFILTIGLFANFSVATIISQSITFPLIMYAFESLMSDFTQIIDWVRENIKTRQNIAKRMVVTYNPIKDNILELVIHNNEKSHIVVTSAHVGSKDGLPNNRQPNLWYKISATSQQLEKGERRTARFIREDVTKSTFSVIHHFDSQISDEGLYKVGVHKFDLKILYDSDERKKYGQTEWFEITVIYKEPKDFELRIKNITRYS